ncbi:MAG: hypothetical protein JKY02_05835 [Flavobacteriaceae bacterium]|nr:hypothetical protein [Flavobacteriaceae bacterium]
MTEDEKYLFLKGFIQNESAIIELLLYAENKFIPPKKGSSLLEDTYINTWEEYYQESKKIGAFETLKKNIPQLQFPVQKGISKTENYINATLKGKSKLVAPNLILHQSDLIKLELYNSDLIGKVPVIIVPNNDDFNSIVCALSNKNEPQELPKSMGALFISGINNWGRIRQLKTNWLKQNLTGNWHLYFKEQILPKPYLFKDKLMVLSTKEYSGVKNEVIEITEDAWRDSSLIIRREHECAHVFTLKYYGCMANNIHDEIIADYAGITKVLGQFNKEWLLHFMGLENYPDYRKGGRLENYQGQKKLSKEVFEGLKEIVKKVSNTIFEFDNMLGVIKSSTDKLNRIKSICEVDLITMASSIGVQELMIKYNRKEVAAVL